MNNKQIKAILMKAGFTEKDQGNGRMDLHPYVYDAARSLLTAQLAELGWLPCSPELLASGVDCAKAPRVLGSQGISHYHQAAQQHQGEPVAWQYRVSAGPATGWSFWNYGKGEQFKDHYTVETRPLYPHADPAEVERLRKTLTLVREQRDNELRTNSSLERERDSLRAQLAEAQALLREVVDAFKLEPDGSCINPGREFIRPWSAKLAALSASAEPSAPACLTCKGSGLEYDSGAAHPCTDCKSSAPVEIDERARFEKAVIDKAERFHPNLEQYGEHPEAEYRDPKIEWAWGLWQARAVLERKS